MIFTLIGTFIFLFIGIAGIVSKELALIFLGFGLFLIPLHYILRECGLEIFIEDKWNNILYGIFYILGGLLIIGGILSLILGIGFPNSDSNLIEDECLSNYNEYNLDLCINNLNGIKTCEKINAIFIKSENHIFSSPTYICEKGKEIIRL